MPHLVDAIKNGFQRIRKTMDGLSAVNNECERVGEYYWANSSSRHHIDRRANDDDDGTKLTLEDVGLTLKKNL